MKLPEKTIKRMPAHLQAMFAQLPNPGSDEVVEAFPAAPGQQRDIDPAAPSPKTTNVYGKMSREGEERYAAGEKLAQACRDVCKAMDRADLFLSPLLVVCRDRLVSGLAEYDRTRDHP